MRTADRGGIIGIVAITGLCVMYHLTLPLAGAVIYGCYLVWKDK